MHTSNVPHDTTAGRRMVLSRHAAKRSQQRGISQDAVPLILAYGERSHDGRGGIRYLMTHQSIEKLSRAVGRSQKMDQLAGCYAVVDADDGQTVITVSHRH